MASLRDVLNHIGRTVVLERGGVEIGRGLGIRRGGEALLEPHLDPRPGDTLRFVEEAQAYRISAVASEEVRGRVDHRRLRLAPP